MDDQVGEPRTEGGFAAGEIDLLKTRPCEGFHYREGTIASEMALWQVCWLNIRESCEAETASHVARLPQMVVHGGYVDRGIQDVPPIQGMCGIDTSNVGSMAAKRNPSWMDKFA